MTKPSLPHNSTIILDVDGTICPLKSQDQSYSDLIPDTAMITKIREYQQLGVKIVLQSSRNMKTFQGNLGLINAHTAIIMQEWLKKWNIPYDEIYFGKPWPGEHGFYVDDRAVRPDEFLSNSFTKLENICKKSTRKPHEESEI